MSEKPKDSVGKAILRWVIDIAVALLIAWLITQAVRPTIVKETSMLPNFLPNDYVFINRLAYHGSRTPQRGDVVIFQSNLPIEEYEESGLMKIMPKSLKNAVYGKEPKKLLIKRVIGLPGETMDVKDGAVYINGKVLDQSYTNDKSTDGDIEGYKIPKGKYICMGDNRLNSIDSRDPSVGPVDADKMVGKVVFRVYRFSAFGRIHNPYQ